MLLRFMGYYGLVFVVGGVIVLWCEMAAPCSWLRWVAMIMATAGVACSSIGWLLLIRYHPGEFIWPWLIK